MGRLYSGNLNALRDASNKLNALDFYVTINSFRDPASGQECMRLHIEDRAGRILAEEAFEHYDEDVLYNTATEWLNRIATQLSTWSKY